MNACAMVGSVWPTLSVPGMSFTGTMVRSLYTAVVVANEPMPSVSKNAVTKPIAVCRTVGMTKPLRISAAAYTISTRPRPTKSSVLASMNELVRIGLRDVDGRGADLFDGACELRAHGSGAVGRHQAVGREHRHRVFQRLHVQRVVVAAEHLRHLPGDLLRRMRLDPRERPRNHARQPPGGVAIRADPVALRVEHRAGIGAGVERLFHARGRAEIREHADARIA